MYDPTIGQFLSEDPIEFEGLDENLLRYVRNRPLSHTDPTGLQSEAELWEGMKAPQDAWNAYRRSADAFRLSAEIGEALGVQGAHNGPRDAIRHAIWNALMAQHIGADAAKRFADAHEDRANMDEDAMDRWNNQVGRAIGAAAGPNDCEEAIAGRIVAAYLNGELVVLTHTNNNEIPAGSPLLPSNGKTPKPLPADPAGTAAGKPPQRGGGVYPGSPYEGDKEPEGPPQYPGSPYEAQKNPPKRDPQYPGSPYDRRPRK